MKRRSFTVAALSSCATSLLPSLATAQGTFPNKPIKFIIPYAAGGQPDVTARALAPRLGERLGQPIVIENKPGAAGSVALAALQQVQPNDGHAFIVSDGAMLSISPLVNKSADYKLGRDLIPVSLIGRAALFLVAATNSCIVLMPVFEFATRNNAARPIRETGIRSLPSL